jgi:transcription-repair coupling factor (superfamily II helicase)
VKLTAAISHIADRLDRTAVPGQWLLLPPMPAAAEALTVCALASHRRTAVLWITRHPDHIEQGRRNLHTLAPALEPLILPFPPVFESGGTAHVEDPDIAGRRIHTLNRLAELPSSATPVIITCTAALLQPTPAPDALAARMQRVELDRPLPPDTLAQRLADTGYQFESEVLDKGQASRRGGILDLWPPDSDWPLRIEWFGNTVESLRFFDPASQRAVEKIASFMIIPARESTPVGSGQDEGCLLDHVHAPLTVFWSDADAIRLQAGELAASGRANLLDLAGIIVRMDRQPGTRHIDTGAEEAPADAEATVPPLTVLPHSVSLPATAGTARLDEARRVLLDDLYARTARRHEVIVFFDSPGSLDHFRTHLARDGKGPELQIGSLSEGFCADSLKLTVVAESDLYGRRKSMQRFDRPDEARGRAGRFAGSRIHDFTDMEEDDLVVHADHGVGRYLGVEQITFNGQLQEVLAIEYAEGARLYVPVTHANLLSRYVGMANRAATLHRLGGTRWAREKGEAQAAVYDLAAELLDIQARRNLLQGHAFPPDSPMQHEFENAFAFEETVDQRTVIRDVRADMESPRPMDRLICGDAGYGKTEVAMRAAFKAVQDQRQVAVLVPTTVLAQQHYQTFSERMAGFGVRIEMISRFQTPAHRRRILETLAEGGTDIIIGTHALVQPGVRFSNLGLVIIDEEQRFGVAHKERLKKVKQLVDVLTLSATPIPRTLYMSMTGARDMSLLRTPPRERVPIETIMAKGTDDVIRDAIRRELARGGQVYFLHNRVVSIGRLRERLASLVPEARIEIAHGQMNAAELSGVMRRFASGEADVLLCTTIIESGLDIPHANTILIDRADRFGIADLYQLRGRVGRADRKAYAFLLLPPHGMVDSDARERIQAVRRHSGLGAGFNLAVRDMEIRGAGNILGAAQSGHISAVGFGLYCQLLQHAVARLKGEQTTPPISVELRLDFIRAVPDDSSSTTAALTPAYVPDERLRVAIYRRMAEATSQEGLDDLALELADRFGPPPPPVQRLLAIAGLRVTAASAGIELIEVRSRKIMIRRGGEFHMENGRFPLLRAASPDNAITELRDRIANL